MAHASNCGVSDATLPSCMVRQVIRNVHDQPESIRKRPAVENLIRSVEFKTIPQPSSGLNFDLRHLRLNSTKKKANKIRDYDSGVQFCSRLSNSVKIHGHLFALSHENESVPQKKQEKKTQI